MITRANIRRQLRASGGITNAISRKDYSMGGSIGGGIIQGNPMGTRTGYFNPFKVVKKAGNGNQEGHHIFYTRNRSGNSIKR